MKRQTETLEEFKARINAAVESEESNHGVNGNDDNWPLGGTQRHKGSLHQDIWCGPAVELANCGYLAVYPAQGWWRTRLSLQRYGSEAKYSLLVSIHAPETDIDLYSAVEIRIQNLIENQIESTT